ncbi:MAG TPA: DUF4956 domain-containing protein [Bacteroidales bacterium]|nr:DUF4956 domain-containing protein [Bacteroidales bacterium]
MDNIPSGFFSLNNPTFIAILLRFVMNIFFIFILIRFIYYKYTKQEGLLFTLFMMGIMVFFITSILGNIFMEMSFAFGLFAIFAIMRFRTSSISIKDMAYIFAVVGMSMMNALKVLKFPVFGIIIFNLLILISAYLLEEYHLRNSSDSHLITYENLDLLKPEKEQKLYRELTSLTGKNVFKVKVHRVDYKRGVALIEIFYKS